MNLQTESTSDPSAIPPPSIYVLSKESPHSINILIKLTSVPSLLKVSSSMLLDSGATGMFINKSFIEKHHLKTYPLAHAVPVHNIDGSSNDNSFIMEEAHIILRFGMHTEQAHLAVTNFG